MIVLAIFLLLLALFKLYLLNTFNSKILDKIQIYRTLQEVKYLKILNCILLADILISALCSIYILLV